MSQLVHDLCNALQSTDAQVLHVTLQHRPDQSSDLLIENAIRETFKTNVVSSGKIASLGCIGLPEEQGGFANALVALSQALQTDRVIESTMKSVFGIAQ